MRNKIIFLVVLMFSFISLAFSDSEIKEIIPPDAKFKADAVKNENLSESALVNSVLEFSGAKRGLGQIQDQAINSYSWYKDKLDSQLYNEGSKIVSEAYSPDKLRKSISQYFMNNFDSARLLAIKKYCDSPLAQKITNLEIKASSQDEFEEIKKFGDNLSSNPPQPQRLELIKKLDQATKGTELQLETILFTFKGMAKAVDTVLAPEKRLQEDELAKISENMRIKLEPILDSGVYVYSLYAYKTLNEEELKEYLNFWVSGDGKWFAQATNSAFKFALSLAAQETADKFAGMLKKIKQADVNPRAPRLRETSVPRNIGGQYE